MNRRTLLALGVAATASAVTGGRAGAVTTEMHVTPANLKDVEGLSVAAEPRDGGRVVRFTVRRDPAKARWQLRSGDLTVDAGRGALAECDVQGRKRRGGVIEYQFTVAADALEHSHFVLREVQGAGADEIAFVGGGEFYDLRLADFTPKVG